jgi:hypothetical protein
LDRLRSRFKKREESEVGDTDPSASYSAEDYPTTMTGCHIPAAMRDSDTESAVRRVLVLSLRLVDFNRVKIANDLSTELELSAPSTSTRLINRLYSASEIAAIVELGSQQCQPVRLPGLRLRFSFFEEAVEPVGRSMKPVSLVAKHLAMCYWSDTLQQLMALLMRPVHRNLVFDRARNPCGPSYLPPPLELKRDIEDFREEISRTATRRFWNLDERDDDILAMYTTAETTAIKQLLAFIHGDEFDPGNRRVADEVVASAAEKASVVEKDVFRMRLTELFFRPVLQLTDVGVDLRHLERVERAYRRTRRIVNLRTEVGLENIHAEQRDRSADSTPITSEADSTNVPRLAQPASNPNEGNAEGVKPLEDIISEWAEWPEYDEGEALKPITIRDITLRGLNRTIVELNRTFATRRLVKKVDLEQAKWAKQHCNDHVYNLYILGITLSVYLPCPAETRGSATVGEVETVAQEIVKDSSHCDWIWARDFLETLDNAAETAT